MKNAFGLFIKGLIIGIGQIVPGVSGGMLAISFGLYERGVDAIGNFFNDIKENLKFLVPLGLGIITSVLMISKAIKYALTSFYFPTMLLFIGLIVGGIPPLFDKVNQKNCKKNITIFLLVFIFITAISFLSTKNSIQFESISIMEVISLFFVGIVYAATMVIPGVSGTAIMMLIGYYDLVITIISSATSISYILSNLSVITPIAIGFIFGVIIISKFMNYLLKKHEISTYFGIIGLVLSSIFIMFVQTFKSSYNVIDVIIGLILLVIGILVSKKLDKI